MQVLWILFCSAFITELCAGESVRLRYGQKLSIKLKDKNNTLEFTSANRTRSCSLWPRSAQCKRGEVSGFLSKSFSITSVRFDDQGTYTQRNNQSKVVSATTLTVYSSTESRTLQIGQTLSISLEGLLRTEASLSFSSSEGNILLVQRGSRVGTLPDNSPIQVSSSSIQVLSVHASDGGRYTLSDREGREVKVVTLRVTASTGSQSLLVGQTLSVPLGDQWRSEASLRFSSKDVTLMLVQRGSPVHHPGYSGRIQVSSSSIQVLSVQVSDGGKYTLLDGKDHEVKVITVKVTDPCASKIQNMDLSYGHQLSIYLLYQIGSLEFKFINETQINTIWSSSIQPERGAVEGSGFDMHFKINSVNFEDQGDYTQKNNFSKVICVTKVKVHTDRNTQYCGEGKTFTISLAGLSSEEATLRFSSKDVNVMLVQRGSPVENLHEYSNRIQVTSSSIQVMNVNASDVGQYTLIDGKGREVKIVTLGLAEPVNLAFLGFLVLVVLVLAVLGYCKWGSEQCQFQISA
uniref:Uncharacterized LOC103040043 n=1 Tax=Astyanax mexicanus TaxID=7994 RepID=A0A3B1IPP1_ASTMX